MDRAVRLANLWNWLPAFRILAETQHLPTAARQLNVNPSSVSRSIKLLEDHLGYRLFERTSRAMRLNDAGRALLAAVREAMRTIDDSLVADTAGAVRLRVAGQAPWLDVLVTPAEGAPAASMLEIVDLDDDDVCAALLRGQIDLALTEHAEQEAELVVERLGNVARGLCHASSRASMPHAVVIGKPDGWPADRPREIGLVTSQLGVVIDACARGRFAAVLPVIFAEARQLVVAPDPPVAASTLYLVRRESTGAPWPVEWIRREAQRLLG